MGNQTVILACPTLAGELKEAMKEAQSDSVVYFMPPGLHRDPKVLHHYVQDKIDHFYNVSKIVVCTTGCGGGNIGITASSAPLLYPKTRDCIDIQPGRFEAGYAWRFPYGKLDGVHEGILH